MYIIPKLLTKFKVLKIDYNPYAESEWILEHNGWGPILCEEQLSETLESDQNLIGKNIKAQIDLDCEFGGSPQPAKEHKKYMSFEGSLINVTGVVLEENLYLNKYYSYLIDSLFPVNASFSSEKINLKPGDWVTVKGLVYLILPRGCNIE